MERHANSVVLVLRKRNVDGGTSPYCGEPKLISAAYVLRSSPDWCDLVLKSTGRFISRQVKDLSGASYQFHSFLRKEVIQPQVPLRLPCYDFTPVTGLAFGGCLLAVGAPTSGSPGSHGVTGGVYKARERIHGAVADAPLLAIPAS